MSENDNKIICKFQRPLFDSKGEMNNVLAYNEDRSFEMIVPLDDEAMEEIFPNEEFKTYWLCEPDEEGYLHPIKQLEEQDW